MYFDGNYIHDGKLSYTMNFFMGNHQFMPHFPSNMPHLSKKEKQLGLTFTTMLLRKMLGKVTNKKSNNDMENGFNISSARYNRAL